MKYQLCILISFFSLISCQKKEQEIQARINNNKENLNNYLEINLDKDLNLFICELTSVNPNIKKDFEIINRNDTIIVKKRFLESDNFDGKNIKIEGDHKFNITIKYNIGFNFSGDEKRTQFLPIDFIIKEKITPNFVISPLNKLSKSSEFQTFKKLNRQKIYYQAYSTFLRYYKNIPENELKSCCISDFNKYQKISKINKKNIYNLDLEKDLITYPDYKFMIINLKDLNTNKSYVIKFLKEENERQNELGDINKTLNREEYLDWEGIYWIYPYDLNSQKIGNYYINIFKNNKEFGFSGDNEFNYKVEINVKDNVLYIFDRNNKVRNPLAIISKDKDNKFYIKSDLIKIDRQDLKVTQNGYLINWAKTSDNVPNLPQY